jgi:hypothetical protein
MINSFGVYNLERSGILSLILIFRVVRYTTVHTEKSKILNGPNRFLSIYMHQLILCYAMRNAQWWGNGNSRPKCTSIMCESLTLVKSDSFYGSLICRLNNRKNIIESYSGRYLNDESTSAFGYLTKFEETHVALIGNLKSSNKRTHFSSCFCFSLLANEQWGSHKSVR